MTKNRNIVKKLLLTGIILWVLFCIGKGIYEEMKTFGKEVEKIENKK